VSLWQWQYSHQWSSLWRQLSTVLTVVFWTCVPMKL
jgi:hypothetical protein